MQFYLRSVGTYSTGILEARKKFLRRVCALREIRGNARNVLLGRAISLLGQKFISSPPQPPPIPAPPRPLVVSRRPFLLICIRCVAPNFAT